MDPIPSPSLPMLFLSSAILATQTQEVAEGRSVIDILLEVDAQLLDEVVVTGYRRKRTTVSSAIGSVKTDRSINFPYWVLNKPLRQVSVCRSHKQPEHREMSPYVLRRRHAGQQPLYIIDGVLIMVI
jgi:hypothetical protein